VTKRTSDLMQPQLEQKIAKFTRAAFPDGIPAYGTDALRFTFYSLASTGRDIKFDLNRMEGFRNFCNKIWNASRYVLMNTEEKGIVFHQAKQDALREQNYFSLADRWILSRFQRTVQQVHEHMAAYRFDLLSQAIYDFFWNEYCDWYVELSKPVLWDEENHPDHAQTTRLTLLSVLEASLRLSHPLMPFITEEIWQRVAPLAGRHPGGAATVMTAPWPARSDWTIDSAAETDVEWIKAFVLGVRQIRGEMDISPSRKLPALLESVADEDRARLATHAAYVQRLAGLESLRVLQSDERAPPSATAVVGGMRVLVPMEGLIDPQAEATRLEKRITKIRDEIKRATAKLANENFVRNAPAEVVVQEKTRIADFERTLASLEGQLQRVRELL
jgi:valyl-tRNA synthetase